MKITKIESFPIAFTKSQMRESLGMINFSWVITKIYTDVGITGFGETPTLSGTPIKSEQTYEETKIAIDKYLAPTIIGMDPFDIERIVLAMDSCLVGHPRSKSAIELGLWDIMGKALNVPVYKLLGGLFRKEIPTLGLVGITTREETEKHVSFLKEKGYKTFKIKIGPDPKQDLKTVQMIREIIGDELDFRVDLNQAYSVSTAIRTLKEMEKFRLEMIEQPVLEWDIDGMAKVADAIDTPILADEPIHSPHDALNVIKKGAADIIIVKPMEGGILKARNIAAVARAGNIPCLVGSTGESFVGFLAQLHFAAATPNMVYPNDVYGVPGEVPWLTETILTELPEFKDGNYIVPEKPGWGIEIDEEKMMKNLLPV